jgi:hypothetical protein
MLHLKLAISPRFKRKFNKQLMMAKNNETNFRSQKVAGSGIVQKSFKIFFIIAFFAS